MPTLGLPAADGGQQASIKRSLSTVAAGWLGSARLYRADGGATTAQFDLLISEPGSSNPRPLLKKALS